MAEEVTSKKFLDDTLRSSAPPLALVVDDEEYIRELHKELLDDLGYNVKTASNSQEAISKFNQEKIKLILTDFKMPGGNGNELIHHVRFEDKELPIILISGSSPQVISEALGGAENITVVGKPTDLKELENRVLESIKESTHLRAETQKLIKSAQQRAAKGHAISTKMDGQIV